MILNRIGNKKKIASMIEQYFPTHTTYVEPFFGAGGMFFNKQKSKYNIVNDNDSDVYNLYKCLLERKDELVEAIRLMPIHQDLFNYWRKNKEEEPIRKAVRFLLLSDFGLYGNNSTMRFASKNKKRDILLNINNTFDKLQDVVFANLDFREFLNSINDVYKNGTFIYADPPYVGTEDNYSSSFKKQDFIDLIQILISKKAPFAVSEFKNDFVVSVANSNGLNVIEVSERQTIKSRNTEVLITNYSADAILI